MSKGRKNHAQDAKHRPRRVAGMATDAPFPSAGPETWAYKRRLGEQGLRALELTESYLELVGAAEWTGHEHLQVQRAGETDDDYERRKLVALGQVESQAAGLRTAANALGLRDRCAKVLVRTRPSDASYVAVIAYELGARWCLRTGAKVPAVALQGATPLLDAMLPDEHVEPAMAVLDRFQGELAAGRPLSVQPAADKQPIAAIHVCAAMSGWIFSVPNYVPDQVGALAVVTEQITGITERLAAGG